MATHQRGSEGHDAGLYEFIIDRAPEGVWLIGARDETVFVNALLAAMLATTPEGMLGRSALEFVPEHEQSATRRWLTSVREGDRFHGELTYVRSDGTEIGAIVSAAPLPEASPARPAVVCFVTDITEELHRRAALESAMRAEQRRFSLVLQHISDIIILVDTGGNVKFPSPASERLLGYSWGDKATVQVLDLIHPDDRAVAAQALRGVADGTLDPASRLVVRVSTAWNSWLYLECVAVNLLDEPGVRSIVITARDVTERHQLTLALEHSARHDQLTDLPNRAYFSEYLGRALARAERQGVHVSVCYLDLDGFKAVNDKSGHAAGDQVLVEVARRIRQCLRPADLPSRLGGDEFALVLEDFSGTGASDLGVAQRLCAELKKPYELEGGRVDCAASIGIAAAQPGDSPESLLGRADVALYQAKRAGRATVANYSATSAS